MNEHDPAVRIRDIFFSYNDVRGSAYVLENVSLTIPSHDFLGLVGPNGGGKTTLLKVILGLLETDSGEVRVLGKPPREVGRRIGYVPQHAQIDSRVPATVLDVVLTGCLGSSAWGFSYGKQQKEAALSAMEQVGVAGLADMEISRLSGGQRQRVLIARALASDAKILLLDEPMAGVDTHMEQGILDLLFQMNDAMPIVLVSHDIGFISTHVKRVACLNRTLTVHKPDEISSKVIDEMYSSHGEVHQIHHMESCPTQGMRSKPKRSRADGSAKK